MKVYLNRQFKILKPYSVLSSSIEYCINKVSYIKGVKKIREEALIYLIELLDHNRIWVTKQELQFFLAAEENKL